MLSIEALRKTYPSGVQALRGLNLSFSGGVLGLLGPNGAGKSTLMKILATLLLPDGGRARIDDIDVVGDPHGSRRLIGYLPQDFGFYPTFTAEQMLDYLARLKGVAASQRRELVSALLDRVALTDVRDQVLDGFSGGMTQRLGIAQALIGRPRLLIVDEPTAGLDPEERGRFHNLLGEVATQDTIVILSTHIVADVASLCDMLAILWCGEIVACLPPAQATASLRGSVWEAVVSRARAPELRQGRTVLSSQLVQGQVRVRVLSPEASPGPGFEPSVPTLEDYYLSVTHSRS